MTKVVNSEGADLDFVDVAYFIDYSDDDGDTLIQVDDLGTKLSGELLTQSAIVDNFGGDSASITTTHNWLGTTVSDYQVYHWEGLIKAMRFYDRKFKSELGLPSHPTVESASVEFRLQEYRYPRGVVSIHRQTPTLTHIKCSLRTGLLLSLIVHSIQM